MGSNCVTVVVVDMFRGLSLYVVVGNASHKNKYLSDKEKALWSKKVPTRECLIFVG